ncbi:hypothetical protein PM082_011346 [Marasmius tenuissimus]|nr:hypothetical protein PM082_011346 [Marasmius tenuissimus]
MPTSPVDHSSVVEKVPSGHTCRQFREQEGGTPFRSHQHPCGSNNRHWSPEGCDVSQSEATSPSFNRYPTEIVSETITARMSYKYES